MRQPDSRSSPGRPRGGRRACQAGPASQRENGGERRWVGLEDEFGPREKRKEEREERKEGKLGRAKTGKEKKKGFHNFETKANNSNSNSNSNSKNSNLN